MCVEYYLPGVDVGLGSVVGFKEVDGSKKTSCYLIKKL